MSCFSESFLSFNHGLNAIVHVLDEINFGSSKSSLVRDVVDVVRRLRVLSMDASDLDVVLIGDLLEVGHFDSELGQLDVNGGSECGTEVGGARGDVTEMLVVGKSSDLLDLGSSLGESSEDGSDVSAWLHRDNPKLILFVDPDEESLRVIMEDTSTFGPVAVAITRLKESVTLLEKEVVGDELGALSVSHGTKGVECTLELSVERVAGLDDLLLDGVSLLTSDARSKREFGKVTADTDTS